VIAVIGCGKAKRDGRHRARDLYTGNIFRAHLKLAEALRPRAIYVASAKYRLIGIDDEIESYDLTLAELGRGEMGDWRREIASRIDEKMTATVPGARERKRRRVEVEGLIAEVRPRLAAIRPRGFASLELIR